MQTINKAAAKILDRLTADLKPGKSRKFGDDGDAYMPVHVECLTNGHYSVAHYFKQNGDLVSDPDMEFYRAETGAWLPVNCTMATGYYTLALSFENGKPKGFYPRALRELCSFAAMWMRNIKGQQDFTFTEAV